MIKREAIAYGLSRGILLLWFEELERLPQGSLKALQFNRVAKESMA
jgi:hypothetical protein